MTEGWPCWTLCSFPFLFHLPFLPVTYLPVTRVHSTFILFRPAPTLILSLCVCIVGYLEVSFFLIRALLRYNSYTVYPFKVYSLVGFSACTRYCSHHHYLIWEYFHYAKKKPHTHYQSFSILPSLQLLASIDLLSISMDLPSLNIHISGIIQYMVFCAWVLSLCITFLRVIHYNCMILFCMDI